MASQLVFASAIITTLLIIISIFFLMHRLRSSQAGTKHDQPNITSSPAEPTILSRTLASTLPDSVILPHDVTFKQSMDSYWAQQECEVVPACVVRPNNTRQLRTAVTILKDEYDKRRNQAGEGKVEGLFAVRSGGHSPIPGAASIQGGVLIDLSLFCEVIPSEDGSSVVIGAGAKWMDVSKILDEKGLAVVGGRNSAVGVGGLTLGGGLSFFSPRLGLVCSNIVSYEVVLASGSNTTASESINPELWRALKGGSNNFGIVTRFTARSFPSTKIWSGFLYMPAFQTTKVLRSFHEYVNRGNSGVPDTAYNNHAAGPIACFSYIHKLGFQAISVNLVYTKPPEKEKKWPVCWKTSGFASLWRLWSTCKVRTLTSATDEMNVLNPPGRRQAFANTTIKNHLATLTAAYTAYYDAAVSLRPHTIKGLLWTLVLQPLLPEWARKGDINPLGLQDGTVEPLVIVSFTINWDEYGDDGLVKTTLRRTVEQIEATAAANKTGHRYRYLNYCAEWQRPFEGYGEENWRFLQGVSRKFDPEGFFQRGCVGGFKLDVDL
ncbi:hypothetical protein MMC28_007177 [Mycoblastus sanguinarius]|nr:hypothetical protein [Mycoblastus sanguinarius]